MRADFGAQVDTGADRVMQRVGERVRRPRRGRLRRLLAHSGLKSFLDVEITDAGLPNSCHFVPKCATHAGG
jgi:hypothetical protein